HDSTDINFLLNISARCNQHLVDGMTLDVHAKDFPGCLKGFIRIFYHLHAAGLAATTGANLGLYHNNAAKFGSDFSGFFGSGCHLARVNRNAMLGEYFRSLILVDVHPARSSLMTGIEPEFQARSSFATLAEF